MASVRIHTKNSADVFDFLQRNKKAFQVEKTSSGFPTFNYADKSVYVRDKVIHRGALSKIMAFQNQVAKSDIYSFVNKQPVKQVNEESDKIEKTILYKGFIFNPFQEQIFKGVIKIDLNSAYWQTCRYFNAINGMTYREIMKKCTKPTRLRITGTLGKKTILSDYDDGKKIGNSYIKGENKRRIVFQNIYNRIRKFVDELMMWCWQQNPQNFIGYYVDCIWLKEYDTEIINKLKEIYKLKIELVDLEAKKNHHHKVVLLEGDELDPDRTPYDVQFKNNEFVIYKNLYNFTPDLKNINLKIQW